MFILINFLVNMMSIVAVNITIKDLLWVLKLLKSAMWLVGSMKVLYRFPWMGFTGL